MYFTKRKRILFEKPSSLMYLPLCYPVCVFLKELFKQSTFSQNQSTFVFTSINILAKFILGLCYFFYALFNAFRRKSQEEKLNTAVVFTKVRYTPDHKKWLVFTYFFIFCVSALNILMYIIPELIVVNGLVQFNWVFVLLNPLFSRLFLKIKIFRHHYLSIGLIIVAFSLTIMESYKYFDGISCLVQTAFSLCGSLIEVGSKFIMDQKYIVPFKFLFYQGICGIILMGVQYALFVILPSYGIKNAYCTKSSPSFYQLLMRYQALKGRYCCLLAIFC